MIQTLQTLPTWLLGVLIIGGATALSVGAMLLLRGPVHAVISDEHNDVVGIIYAVVGAMYAIFLAFLIVIDWDQYNAASAAVANEAATLGSLYRSTDFLPGPVQSAARRQLIAYTTLVISKEWKTMANGTDRGAVDGALDRLYHTYGRLNRMRGEQAASTEAAPLLDRLSTQRAARIDASNGSLNDVFWVILLFGAVVTVAFAFLFYLDNVLVQGLTVGSVAALIASLLFLLLLVDHPFSGDIHVSPDPFQTVLEHMKGVGGHLGA